MSLGGLVRCSAAPFLIALAAGMSCYAAARGTLGFYLGGVGMMTILLPALVVKSPSPYPLPEYRERGKTATFVRAAAVIDGIGVVWLLGLFHSLSLLQWLTAYAVLVVWGLALAGLVLALKRGGIAPVGAAAIAVVIGLVWLTWPVWLAAAVRSQEGTRLAAWLVPAHPLLALNGALGNHGIWLQQSVIYRHVTLGQDAAYSLPRSILPCVVVHLSVAAALTVVAGWRRPMDSKAGGS